MDNKINVNKSQNNVIRVTSNNVQQLEKQAEAYANSADKSRQDCANYLALVQRILQECVSVRDEINVSYVSDLTDHVEDDNNPHKVSAEQVNSYTKSEVDELLQNIDVTVDGISSSNLYVKDEVDNFLSQKIDKSDVYTKTEIDNKHYLTKHQDISGKVDKVTGKGLSTNDFTTAEKTKLAGLSNYDDTAILSALNGKADVNHTHSQYLTEHQDRSGKADINHTHSQYLTTHQDISGKVDKVTGKGLSTEDYTTAEKTKLAGLSNYDDTEILSALEGKADVEDIPTKMSEFENDMFYVSGYSEENWVQPILSSNGIMGGDSFAVSGYDYLHYLFDRDTDSLKTSAGFSNCVLSATIYNPIPIKITSIVATGNDDNFEGTKGESEYIKGSNDGINWTDIVFSGVFDTTGAILTNNNYFKYYKFKVQSYYHTYSLNITATYRQQSSLPDISGKVDKVTGKGLSTEDYTTAEKTKLAGLSNYDDTEILSALEDKADVNHTHSQYLTEHQDISGKVDKVTGKGLSTEDYTTAEKTKLAGLSNYDDTEILSALEGKADVNHTHSQYLTEHQDISGKVDKVTGKGLSTEDYTTAEKTKLAGLSNYDDTEILSALDGKADVNHTHSQYLTEHQDISGKQDKSNLVTTLSASSTDTQYPSAKCVYDLMGNIETLLSEV